MSVECFWANGVKVGKFIVFMVMIIMGKSGQLASTDN